MKYKLIIAIIFLTTIAFAQEAPKEPCAECRIAELTKQLNQLSQNIDQAIQERERLIGGIREWKIVQQQEAKKAQEAKDEEAKKAQSAKAEEASKDKGDKVAGK